MRKLSLSAFLCTLIFYQAASAQTYAQKSPPTSGSGVQPGLNNNLYPSQSGYAQPHYSDPASGQPPVSSQNSSLGRLLDDVKGLVKDIVQVNVTPNGSQSVRVKAPFVDVGVDQGQGGVHVKAPFVNVDKPLNAPMSVKAPLTNIQAPGINAESVDVRAPFTNIHAADDSSVRITAPFTDVKSGSGSGAMHIHAPFTNVEAGGNAQIQTPPTNMPRPQQPNAAP